MILCLAVKDCSKIYPDRFNFTLKSRSNKFKMQAKAKTPAEHELVEICMAELCRKAGFADAEKMIQRDLQFLCESIEVKTGVLISLSTIRRLLNGQFSRLPQIATLNAIVLFLGYQNWQSFKLAKTPGAATGAVPPRKTGFTYARFLLFGGLLLLATLALLAIM